MNILLVGGTFNYDGGRLSGYFAKLSKAIAESFPDAHAIVSNGGNLETLARYADDVKYCDLVIWGADVPNGAPKLVNNLKKTNPNMMLVITKNNISGNYTRKLLAARALDAKANLLIEFKRDDYGNVLGSIIDPLGNCFIENEVHPNTVSLILTSRLKLLASMTRVGSIQVGDIDADMTATTEVEKFLALTRRYAKTFHELIHADDNGRMLGNISFRCESGFPTYRDEDFILVSKRNIDKRDIGMSAMVPVKLNEVSHDASTKSVEYLGHAKPSVDTPIQRGLYKAWPNANFMLHAHVYIEGAPFTENMIPCGALQEIDEILKVLPDYSGDYVACINLIGHGSIAIAKNASMLENIPYIARALM